MYYVRIQCTMRTWKKQVCRTGSWCWSSSKWPRTRSIRFPRIISACGTPAPGKSWASSTFVPPVRLTLRCMPGTWATVSTRRTGAIATPRVRCGCWFRWLANSGSIRFGSPATRKTWHLGVPANSRGQNSLRWWMFRKTASSTATGTRGNAATGWISSEGRLARRPWAVT
jgi:hypothetical protein